MYDITNTKVLRKVGNKLIRYGFERVNYSVWIGWTNPLEKGTLKNELLILFKEVKYEQSKLYVIPLKPCALEKMRSINGHKPLELDYWLGKSKTLFL